MPPSQSSMRAQLPIGWKRLEGVIFIVFKVFKAPQEKNWAFKCLIWRLTVIRAFFLSACLQLWPILMSCSPFWRCDQMDPWQKQCQTRNPEKLRVEGPNSWLNEFLHMDWKIQQTGIAIQSKQESEMQKHSLRTGNHNEFPVPVLAKHPISFRMEVMLG